MAERESEVAISSPPVPHPALSHAITRLQFPNGLASRIHSHRGAILPQGPTLDLPDRPSLNASHVRRPHVPANGALDLTLRALGFTIILLAAWKLFNYHSI